MMNRLQKSENLPPLHYRNSDFPSFEYDMAIGMGLEVAIIFPTITCEFKKDEWYKLYDLHSYFEYWSITDFALILEKICKSGFMIRKSMEYKATDNLYRLVEEGYYKYVGLE